VERFIATNATPGARPVGCGRQEAHPHRQKARLRLARAALPSGRPP
jgi:hypothetical protein